MHRGGEEARLVSSWSSLLDYWTTCRLIFFWASWPLVYYWRARLTSFCLTSVSSPKNSLFNNCSFPSHTFHMLSSAPPTPSQRRHVLQPSAHLKAAIASLLSLLPATTSQDPCLSGAPACTILFQCFCVYTPSFRDQYCLQITIKFNYLKICWLYDQTIYDDCLEIYLFLLSWRPVVIVWWFTFYGQRG